MVLATEHVVREIGRERHLRERGGAGSQCNVIDVHVREIEWVLPIHTVRSVVSHKTYDRTPRPFPVADGDLGGRDALRYDLTLNVHASQRHRDRITNHRTLNHGIKHLVHLIQLEVQLRLHYLNLVIARYSRVRIQFRRRGTPEADTAEALMQNAPVLGTKMNLIGTRGGSASGCSHTFT